MTLRQTIQAAPEKAAALITKLAATSNQAVKSREREFATGAMHNWMERRTAMLQIAQRSSKQALSPLQARVSETA